VTPAPHYEGGLQGVYIGRAVFGHPNSKWLNPYKVDKPGKPKDGTPDQVVAKFRDWIVQQPELMTALHELRGKDLVCWCAPERCHGDVLIELLNGSPNGDLRNV
jgi:hypothetical protein